MDFSKLFDQTIMEALSKMDGPFWFADEFCHYTNLSGLIGILESREIWLSDYRLLNDTKEVSYGRELAVKVISEIALSEQDAEFSLFLQSIVSEISKPSNEQYYICSMSLAIDELVQWRAYAKDCDGVCIVFNGNKGLWNKSNSHPTNIRQRRIVYKEHEQIETLKEFIDIYRSKFNEFKSFIHPFKRDLAWLIEQQFIRFKHRQYESEQEIRLTIENLPKTLKMGSPMHRISNGLIVPYITTSYISDAPEITTQNIPIKEIIVSSLAKQETITSIKIYLENKGLNDIEVKKSTVNFRG